MDVLSQFDMIVPAFQTLAGNVSTGQLDDETPCSEWAIRDLFGHVLGGATFFAAAVRGDAPTETTPADDESLAGSATAAVIDVDAAFREPGALERTVSSPFGEMPGDAFARLLAFDLLMHTWDLAQATQQSVDVPDELVAAVDAFAHQAITAEWRRPGAFGPEAEPAAGATPLERLVAFSGRTS